MQYNTLSNLIVLYCNTIFSFKSPFKNKSTFEYKRDIKEIWDDVEL